MERRKLLKATPILILVMGSIAIIGFHNQLFAQNQAVLVTTDKIEYSQGEDVKIIKENNTNKVVCFCGSTIEQFTEEGWVEIKKSFCDCSYMMCDRNCTCRNPKGGLEDVWKQKKVICNEELKSYTYEQAAGGKYRIKARYGIIGFVDSAFVYSDEFRIK